MVLTRQILDSVLERAADEVFLLNPDGSVRYVNQSTLDRRRFSREEMMRMHVWDWNTFVTEDSWKRRWESLLKLKRARFETRHLDKDGTSFPVDIQAHYLSFDEGEFCVCFANDISELAEKVYELGKKHRELAEAKDRADAALAALQDLQDRRSLLFATIAHELRTPISAISMLCSDDSAESWAEARVHIQSLSRDLLHTLDDMRRLTRDNYRREVTSESFTLTQLLESVQLSVSAYITRYQMVLEFDLAEELSSSNVELFGDLYRLKIVLSNLMKNACVHSGGNHIRLSVTALQISADAYELSFKVEDNGRGIPAEQIETLFSPYARGATDADGSGLGLHIARSWIQELGGSLHNIPTDAGAAFEICIELKALAKTLPEPQAGADSLCANDTKGDFSPDEIAHLSVLFVEDDRMIQMVGKKLLSKIFDRVEVASDGVQAVDKLSKSEFDLVLTDYFMPNMSGLELIRQLRSSGYEGVIYACSAATLGDELDDLVEAGANDVFSKPLSLNKLMACLANDANSFRARCARDTQGNANMEKSDKAVSEILQQQADKALLLIDLQSGEILGTENWRKLNAVDPQQTLTRTLLNKTIPDGSREAYLSYCKQFFQSPVEAAPVSIDLNLCALDGRQFRGRITSHKVVSNGAVLACTEVEEI